MDRLIVTLISAGIVIAIAGITILIYSIIRMFKRKKKLRTLPSVLITFLLLAAIGSSFFYLGLFLQTFSRYTAEDHIAWVYAEADDNNEISVQYYDMKNDSLHEFTIFGDEWMIEGKFLRWNLMLRFLGKGAYYKVVRISGRWEDRGPPSFYQLEENPGIWKYILKHYKDIPFVDTAYGIGAFQYATGDTFDVYINDTGFILRKR